MGTGFLATVGQSGFLGRAIVVFLFAVSIYSWAVIAHKYGVLRRAGKRCATFLSTFREDPQRMVDPRSRARKFEDSPYASIYDAGLEELMLTTDGKVDKPLTLVQVDGIERTLERAVAEQVIDLRRHLIALATTAGAAPFVGLFGTVWGIMKAFAAMSITGSASIGSVAPGVSAALTTTVAGLAVAIPALVGYNYLLSRVRNLTVGMENFSSEFISAAERHLGSR